MSLRVLVLHNQISAEADPSERDVLVQCDAVQEYLHQLGHESTTFGCGLNLQDLADEIRRVRPDVVFNLLESLGGTDRLMPLVTLLLDALGVPYTGASTRAILDTIGKLTSKTRLRQAGLPAVGAWSTVPGAVTAEEFVPGTTVIIKPVWEHASIGMTDDAVAAFPDQAALVDALRRRESASGLPCFAEPFIDGREFNLSVLGRPAPPGQRLAPEVLPPAEIDFSAFPDDKPGIVGYAAKWDEASFEFRQTPRRFDFPAADEPLLASLRTLTEACWELFGLSGYARVDFRVDSAGQPWILEVNVNPCLSPDAGFVAALQQAEIPLTVAMERILVQALPTFPR